MRFILKPNCKDKLTPFQSFVSILALLGIANIFAVIFMVVIWSGEQIGIMPLLGVFYIDGLTEGENWILFVSFIIFTFFVALIIIWLIYRGFRNRYCSNLDGDIENYPKKFKELI